jgi:hypothetical protein
MMGLGSGRPLLLFCEQCLASGPATHGGEDEARAAYEESHRLTREDDSKATLIVGKDDWPLPVPLIKEGSAWRFNAKAGWEEILDRRIGQNELSVIQVMLAYVDA